jgi:hypothetical protein
MILSQNKIVQAYANYCKASKATTHPGYQQLRQLFLAHSSSPIMLDAKGFSRTILHDLLLPQNFDVVRGLVGHELPLTSTVTVVQAQETNIAAQEDENGGPVRAAHDDECMVAS